MAEDTQVVGVADSGNNVVGAPLAQDTQEWKPRLAGKGPETVVTVFNPLTNDFRFQHARSVTQPAPLSKEAQIAEEKGGLSMAKDMGQTQAHYSQYWILKAGESKNLPGDIAQKAVQDLITYILMSRAKKGEPKNVADGYARAEVEKEIVIAVHDNTTFMNSLTPEEATNQEVSKLNPTAPPLEEPAKEPENPEPGKGVKYDVPSPTSRKPAKKA